MQGKSSIIHRQAIQQTTTARQINSDSTRRFNNQPSPDNSTTYQCKANQQSSIEKKQSAESIKQQQSSGKFVIIYIVNCNYLHYKLLQPTIDRRFNNLSSSQAIQQSAI